MGNKLKGNKQHVVLVSSKYKGFRRDRTQVPMTSSKISLLLRQQPTPTPKATTIIDISFNLTFPRKHIPLYLKNKGNLQYMFLRRKIIIKKSTIVVYKLFFSFFPILLKISCWFILHWQCNWFMDCPRRSWTIIPSELPARSYLSNSFSSFNNFKGFLTT